MINISMKTKLVSFQHLVFTLACLVGSAICVVVRILRHDVSAYSSEFKYLLGIAPNFGAALAILFGIEIYFTILIKKSKLIDSSPKEFGLIALITFFCLALWELLQFVFLVYPIDVYDIVATLVGILFSYLLFLITPNKQLPKEIYNSI